MAIAAILLSLSPFLVAEVCIRNFTTTPDAIDVDPVAGLDHLRPLFELDRSTLRYEIPDWRLSFFCRDSFPAEKSPDTRRIFVLGGSTVQGRPYATETAFSTWLRLRLRASDDQHQYEVVNCGGVSYASYRVAKILDEVIGYEPDAIVLYTGHNEFLEDRSFSHVRELGSTRRAISRVASHWKTVGWLQRTLFIELPIDPLLLATEVDTRLDHVGGLDSYQPDPRWRSDVERQFNQTFSGMIATCQQAKIPIVVCTPTSDIVRTPPFKSDGSNPQNDAAAIYARGLAAWQAGRADEAKRLLESARDLDVCPLRATRAIVDSVRQVCRDFEVPMVDTDRIFDQRDWQGTRIPDEIADPEFFCDHVHPTILGHQRIAGAVAETFDKLGWCTANQTSLRKYDAAVIEHSNQLGEAYYARGAQRLAGLKRWAAGRASLPLSEDD